MSQQLPSSPNLRHLKNEAKRLLKQWSAVEPAALHELRLLHPSFELLTPEQLATKMNLHNAQLALAHRYGFHNWPSLCARVAVMKHVDLSALTSEQAAVLFADSDDLTSISAAGIAAIRAEKLAKYERGRPFRENGTLYISEKRGLTREEALNDTAKIHDMPPVGTRYMGAQGIEWTVTDYGHFVAPPTMARYPNDCDYLPIVMPLKVSPRLKKLFYEVDHCTSKRVVLLDTMPAVHPFGLGKNIHCANMNTDPAEVRLFLDVQNAHETLIAHELMHLWMWFVEGNVGEKTLKNQFDKANRNQLDFIQSFVLDVRVNDLIEKRGFDMSQISDDQIRGLEALRKLMMLPEFSPNRRELLMYALQIAGAILEQDRLSRVMKVQLAAMLEFFEAATPEIHSTAMQLVEIVNRRPLDTRDALRKALDECTILGFRFTGDNLDLERDFNLAVSPECMQDKFPDELTKYKVPLKLEIWKTMSRLGIEGYGQIHVNTSPSGMAVLTFEPESGGLIGPIHLNYRMSPPEWIIDQERERVLREQRQMAAIRTPVDPQAPYRHIPYNERPRINGMIPDDYGRLPGENGYNTSYPPGQDPFTQMQRLNNEMHMHGGGVHGQFGGPQQGNAPGADQYGRLPGHPDHMMPFPPGHPASAQWSNPVNWSHVEPSSAGPPVFPWLDTSRNYMAGLTRSIAEARLAQQIASNSANLYQYVLNNPVNLVDPSGYAPAIDPPSDCNEYANVSAGLAMACAAIKSSTGKACISRLSSGYGDCISNFCNSSANIHCGSHGCAQHNCDPKCAPNCCYVAETNPHTCNMSLCTATIGQQYCLPPTNNVVQSIAVTLLHEYMHCCGMLDHSRDGKDPNNPAEDVARCIMGLPGHISPY